MSEQPSGDKQNLAPLLVGGTAGSLLGLVTVRGERIMSERSHLIVGGIVGGLLGTLLFYSGSKLRKE